MSNSQNQAAQAATQGTRIEADLLNEVADVLAENNWRGDLVEALREMAEHYLQNEANREPCARGW